jgi:tetratricopeptide (TPR) repeat protein
MFVAPRNRQFVVLALLASLAVPAGAQTAGTGATPAGDSAAPLTPAYLTARAWEDYRDGEYATAVHGFSDAAHAAPAGSADRLEALYGLGMAWNLRGSGSDPALAEKCFREVLTLSPTGELAAWSLLALARMKHAVPVGEEPDYPAVRKAYQDVIDRFPNHLAGEEAFIYLESTWVATLDPKDAEPALVALEGFIRDHAASKFLSPAWALVAECEATLGRSDERLKAKIASLETRELDPTNPYSDNAALYWEIATIAEFEAGDFATARKYYRALADEYPLDQRKWGAKLALERMDAVEAGLRAGGR